MQAFCSINFQFVLYPTAQSGSEINGMNALMAFPVLQKRAIGRETLPRRKRLGISRHIIRAIGEIRDNP
ncbi:MAG: hypothetical protein OXI43_02530 [Candidatus Poribacteria bacterium]|nr:hypothetical protein [Candidatus Poribacteria bacterium]